MVTAMARVVVLLGAKVVAAVPLVMPFVLAVALHGVYNFFAGFSGGFWWFSVVAILMAALECRIWYRKAAGMDGEAS